MLLAVDLKCFKCMDGESDETCMMYDMLENASSWANLQYNSMIVNIQTSLEPYMRPMQETDTESTIHPYPN